MEDDDEGDGCSVIPCPVLSYALLFCSVLSCPVPLFCSVLFCSVLCCSVIFLFWNGMIRNEIDDGMESMESDEVILYIVMDG